MTKHPVRSCLDIVTRPPTDHFTNDGKEMAKLPDFSSVEMSRAVFYALTRHKCGRDLIVISSMLSVLNTSDVLVALPDQYKSPDGDFMTILNMMNEVLNAKQSMSKEKFQLKSFCQKKGLASAYPSLEKACKRYETLQKSFNISKQYRKQSQVQSGNWELIGKSLLKGYSDNVFVSLKELQGRTDRYTRYQSSKSTTIEIEQAVIDRQSTLNRSKNTSASVSLVVARDIRYATSVRAKAILSFVGQIKPQWIEYDVERQIRVNNVEKQKLNEEKIISNAQKKYPHAHIQIKDDLISINGPSGAVLNAELFILQGLVEDLTFSSESEPSANREEDETLQRNLEGIMKMLHIFNPMKWRWENQEQVKITFQQDSKAQLQIIVRGRDSKNRLVLKEFLSALSWLQKCVVIRTPNSGNSTSFDISLLTSIFCQVYHHDY